MDSKVLELKTNWKLLSVCVLFLKKAGGSAVVSDQMPLSTVKVETGITVGSRRPLASYYNNHIEHARPSLNPSLRPLIPIAHPIPRSSAPTLWQISYFLLHHLSHNSTFYWYIPRWSLRPSWWPEIHSHSIAGVSKSDPDFPFMPPPLHTGENTVALHRCPGLLFFTVLSLLTLGSPCPACQNSTHSSNFPQNVHNPAKVPLLPSPNPVPIICPRDLPFPEVPH